ncbi:MAG: lipoate--protein ligase family protein [Candidatus Omnitrophota bacterium]
MDLRVISFSSPEKNILFDQVLWQRAEEGLGEEVLRFWESETPFIVLGKTSKADQEIVADHVERDHISIVRRTSAGGVVVQGKGCLNFTLVLSKAKNPEMASIASSYAFILEKVILALKGLNIQARFYPPCDLALAENNRKFSGNAQRRGKNFILHHGTLLHHFDCALAKEYLTLPSKVPLYRANRSHQDFMANLNVDPKDIIKAFLQVFKIEKSNHHLEPQEFTYLDSLMKREQTFQQ